MSYKLELEKEAIIDIQQAFEWYESQRKELGYFFVEEVEETFQKICDSPQHYTKINNVLRRIKVNKFPYVVIFEIENKTIFVNAIRHTSRLPKQ